MGREPSNAIKAQATRRSMSVEQYLETTKSSKWCSGCQQWHPRDAFASDASRYDGLTPYCRDHRRATYRNRFVPIPTELRLKKGPPRAACRDDDKKQARKLVNLDVRNGMRPPASQLHCAKCGHKGEDRRHQYHHHMGYSAERHYDVLVLCEACHLEEHRNG